jgi:hypothetical protein
MEKIILICLLCLCGQLSAFAEDTVSLDNPTEAWRRVLDRLSDDAPLRATFEEFRSIPSRNRPIRFMGTIRWAPELGLSLAYQEPKPLGVHIFEDAMYISVPGKSLKVIKGRKRKEAMTLFPRLFAWDTAWLAEHFITQGVFADDGSWHLSMVPVDDQVAGAVSKIILRGGEVGLHEIVLELKADKVVQIKMLEQIRPALFTEEERRSAFPAIYDE